MLFNIGSLYPILKNVVDDSKWRLLCEIAFIGCNVGVLVDLADSLAALDAENRVISCKNIPSPDTCDIS